ncbi:hypothetical protein M3Y96_00423700 [Aphelenchoides besseyi]|nr:hypothetical protein M3Y96_00423700 [Aphelenchoides besseyi]
MSISTPLKSFDDSDSEDLSRMICLDMTEEDRFMDLGNKLLPTSSQCSVEDSKRSDRASQFNSSVRNECSNGNQSSSMKKFARFTLNSQNETSQSMRTAWKSTTSSNTDELESRPEIKPLTHSPSSSSSGRELLSESRTSVALLSDSIAVYRLRKSVADPNNAVGVIVDVSLKVNKQNELNDRSVTYQPGDRVLLPDHRGILYSDNAIPGVIFELYHFTYSSNNIFSFCSLLMSKAIDELKAQGDDQFERGYYAEAINSYNLAIFIAKSKDKSKEERAAISVLYTYASQAYIKIKQSEEAVNSATNARLWDPNAQTELYYRAIAKYCLRKIDEAKVDLDSFLKLDPTNNEVLNMCKRFGFLDLIEKHDKSKKNGQGWRRAFIMAYLRPHFLSSGFASTLQSLMSGSMVIGDNSFRSSNPCAKLNLPFAFQRLAHSDVVFSVLTLWFQKHSLMTLFRVIELTDIDYIISNAKEDNNLSVVLHKEKHFSHAKTYDPLLLTEFTKDILLRGELAKSITRLKTVGPLIDPLKMSFPSLKVSAFDLNQCFLTSKPMHKHVSDGISDWARNPPSLPIECLCLENASRFDIISTFHNVCPTLKQATIYCLLVPDPNIEDRVIVDPQFRWKAEQLKAFAPNLKEVIGTAQFNVHYSEVDTYFRLKIIDKIRQLLLAVEKLRCPWAKTEVLTNIAFVTEENRLRISRAKHLRFLDMFVEDTRLHNELKLESIKLMMGTNLRKRLTRRIARKGNPAKTENMTLDETTEESPTVESENERRRPILESQLASIMNAFVDHVASLGFEGLRCEHAQLKAFLPDNRSTFAFEANRMRNRYTDQLCYDATRVKLTYNVPPDVDYIHANVVDIPGVGNRFICTQEKTVCIVKLCHFEEDGKSKCAQYFPQIEGETKEYGYFVVRHTDRNFDRAFDCTTLELAEKTNPSSLKIQLFAWKQWPDKGVPRSGFGVLRLIRNIREFRNGNVVVYEIVKDLRCRRHNSVQTEAQYLFIHRTLCEYMKSKGLQRSAIPQFLTEYAIHMKNLANPIPLPIQQAPIQQPPVQQPQRPAPLLQQQQVQSTPQLAAQPALIMQQQPQT